MIETPQCSDWGLTLPRVLCTDRSILDSIDRKWEVNGPTPDDRFLSEDDRFQDSGASCKVGSHFSGQCLQRGQDTSCGKPVGLVTFDNAADTLPPVPDDGGTALINEAVAVGGGEILACSYTLASWRYKSDGHKVCRILKVGYLMGDVLKELGLRENHIHANHTLKSSFNVVGVGSGVSNHTTVMVHIQNGIREVTIEDLYILDLVDVANIHDPTLNYSFHFIQYYHIRTYIGNTRMFSTKKTLGG